MAESELAIGMKGTAAAEPRHQGVSLWRRVRRRGIAVVGVILLVSVGLTAAVGPYFLPYGPVAQPQESASFEGPSPDHPFGTDKLGRDVLARVVHGARVSLGIGFAAVVIGVAAGTLLGVVSAYYGGSIDYLLQRLVEVTLAFPAIVALIVMAAAVGSSTRNIILILAVYSTPGLARIVRSIVVAEREQPYIEAARSLGASNSRILFRHLVPSTFPLAGILASLLLGTMILAEASLSFLGLGVQEPNASWGADMNRAREYLSSGFWWLAVFPGVALSLTILSANLIADAVRDIVDPFSKQWAAGR